MKSNFKELFSNMLVFAISNIGTKLILFFLVPLYTNYLSSAELGTADLVTTTTSLVIPLITLSITESVYRFSMDSVTDNKEVLRCFYYVYLFSTILSIAGIAALQFIPSFKPYSLLFVLIILTTIINDGYALYVKGNGRNKIFAIDNIVYVASLAATNIIFLVGLKLGIQGYLLAIVVAKSISFGFLILFGKTQRFVNPVSIDRDLLKSMLRYSIPLLFNSINWWVISSSDKYMLNYMISSSEVGLYTVASKVPALVNTATTVFTEAWTISSIKEYEGGQGTGFYNRVFELFSVSMAILVSGIMLIARPFMGVYVAESYSDAVRFLPTLLMSAYYLGFSSFIGVTFSTVMKSKVIMHSSLVAAVLNIIVNFLLIPHIGGLGAAIATMFTYVVISVYRYYHAQKYMTLTFSKGKFLMTVGILTIQQIAVTIDFHWVVISILALMAIVIIHMSTVKNLTTTLVLLIKSRFGGNHGKASD